MLTGTIADFSAREGRGLIIPEDGPGTPVSVYLADLPRDSGLRLGDRVAFLIAEDRAGRQRAVDVRRAGAIMSADG